MEVAASGIAVASIAIQLLDSTSTIRTFIYRVKDASQELLRVANLLDRLDGILQVVVDPLDQQASLQDQLFPIPKSLSRCLQRCKESLVPLQETVDKYSKNQASNRLRRLQADVRAALRADDLRSLENRLQQEIDIMSLALVANSTRVQ
jgi:3'-phosphoadenosine 5'-phosphosulfate sulfotransferase (PAPS reductase)/FAD synthetase